MSENTEQAKPTIWIVDSERSPLASCMEVMDYWAKCIYVPWGQPFPDWDEAPDALFFSAEIRGGANGEFFTALLSAAGNIPLITIARLRSLAQAVAYFRAGAADYLSLPLDGEDARERFVASIDRAAQLAMQGVMVELEPVDPDPGNISLTVSQQPDASLEQESSAGVIPDSEPDASESEPQEEDILAQLSNDIPTQTPILNNVPLFTMNTQEERDDAEAADPAPDAFLSPEDEPEDEPEAVDGLPIPSLWEELPCGLLMFDSLSNLVFSNQLGLELFGCNTFTELQETLEKHRGTFAAYGVNNKPFADNQWPHLLATRTRTPRSAVLSIEKPDRRRVWLRIDCMPHMTEGRLSRLTMTLVNLTGELPSLSTSQPEGGGDFGIADSRIPVRDKKDKGKRRGKKKH